jgi:hypothetical protein
MDSLLVCHQILRHWEIDIVSGLVIRERRTVSLGRTFESSLVRIIQYRIGLNVRY